MVCVLIYLFIPFTAAGLYGEPRCMRENYANDYDIPQDCLDQKLSVDLWPGQSTWRNSYWRTRHHTTRCLIELWQIVGSEKKLIMLSGFHNFNNVLNLPKTTNLDYSLWIGTTCGDGAWVDRFRYDLRRRDSKSYEAAADTRSYGIDNYRGWCLSFDRGDWSAFGGDVPERTCFKTLELEAFNNINRGSEGRVWGYHQTFYEKHSGRRMLDSEPSANDYVPVLEQYHQCVNTLGDVPACDSLADAALELFNADQELECTLSLYDQKCKSECNEGRLRQTVVSTTFDEPVFESTSRGEISGLRLSGPPGCSFTFSCEHDCFSNTHFDGGAFEVKPYSFTFTIGEDGGGIVKSPMFISGADMPVFKLDGTETSLEDMTGASVSVGKFDDIKQNRRNLYDISTPNLTKETRRKL